MIRSRDLLASFKAAGEATRLRILALLHRSELTVTDLTFILGQSQPRVSRHLRLLVEAGLLERYREGSWVYFRIGDTAAARLIRGLLAEALAGEDAMLSRDGERAEAVRREKAAAAQAYFEQHASEWDRIRALHVAEQDVERAMLEVLGAGPFELLVDIGTGTGRVLQLFADRCRRAVGLDINQAMLNYARLNLEREGLTHCQVRQGDLYHLPLPGGRANAVVLHQVLHFLDDPARAVREAVRLLAPGGRLLIVDFAPHDLEFLRAEQAHVRLGFSGEQIAQWMEQAGVRLCAQRDLVPTETAAARAGKPEKLTVSIWLSERPASGEAIAEHDRRSDDLERVR